MPTRSIFRNRLTLFRVGAWNAAFGALRVEHVIMPLTEGRVEIARTLPVRPVASLLRPQRHEPN